MIRKGQVTHSSPSAIALASALAPRVEFELAKMVVPFCVASGSGSQAESVRAHARDCDRGLNSDEIMKLTRDDAG